MDANTMRQEFNLRFGSAIMSNKVFDDREIESFINKAQLEWVKNRIAAWKNRPQLGLGDHPVRDAELSGLLTATVAIPREQHLLGTEDNGALYGPDLDQGGDTQEADKFGVFVGIPDEVLYVVSERVSTQKGTYIKPNGKVKKVTKEIYERDITNSYNNPGPNLTWSMDWGSYTTASNDINGAFTNSSKEYSDSGTGFNMQGDNYLYALEEDPDNKVIINTMRSVYLIPGKGWKILNYRCHYIKAPADVHIDVETPSLQINCQLPNFVHSEIVDYAVKLASAAVVPEPNKYQVNQLESKEDE